MERAAVLTGEVIASNAIAVRGNVPGVLEEAFAAVARIDGALVKPFEIYRGDSFQGVVHTAHAVRVATIVRARLRAIATSSDAAADRIDARVAIGIGRIDRTQQRAVVSDGEAFRLSSRALDELTAAKEGRRLRVDTADARGDDGPDLAAQLLDPIVLRWSRPAAEAVYAVLTDAKTTQAELAERLHVSQPAISQRLKSARLRDVRKLLGLYASTVAAASPG